MHRINNFDFLRFLFASFVIITHSYPLTGAEECDILCQISNGQENLSYLGVRGFFTISGYLIFQSLMNSKSIPNYLWKRFLRIYPALTVALIFSVFICYFVYDSDIPYWENTSVWSYIPKNLAFFSSYHQNTIKGVFSDNRYSPAINGSLWSIPYEIAAYIIIIPLIIFKYGKKEKLLSAILLILSISLIIMAIFFPNRGGNYNIFAYIFSLGNNMMINVYSYFFIGCFLASCKIEQINSTLKNKILVSFFLLIILSILFGGFHYVKFTVFPIFVILIGTSSWNGINKFGEKFGDLSYGMYIYSFPIQQTIEHFLHPSPPL